MTVDQLKEQVHGEVIVPADPTYDEARAVHNGMIDKYPSAVLKVANTGDVMSTIRYARENDLDLAIRGGGHSGPGFGTVDDGVVIDFSKMRSVRVNPAARTARADAGATWGDMNAATHAFGLATPGG
ncbi:MAG: FAD-binding protein, partial [Chloroflexi bacterium]|nr:FAD-binding protein [Chloroflexota bacterium]